MRKLLPQPALSLVLLLLWLLLNNSISPGHILLGSLFAITIPWLTSSWREPGPPLKRPGLLAYYFLLLLWDIVVSNIQVAIQVCGPIKRLQPGFLAYPLQVQSGLAQTILASTISLTPGTVSAELSEDRRWLFIHSLHIEDEQTLLAGIHERYEKRLQEIFESC